MDANGHTMDSPLRKMLGDEGVGLIEFSHKYWGAKPPNIYINVKIPIDAGYRLPDLEVYRFCMLSFINSPGDHRSWIAEITTRSMLGKNLYKIERPAARRLVCCPQVMKKYNEIVSKKFGIHRIQETR